MDSDETVPVTVYSSTSKLGSDGEFHTYSGDDVILRQDAIETFLSNGFELINSVSYSDHNGDPSIVDTFSHYDELEAEQDEPSAKPKKRRFIPDIKGIFDEELLSKRRVRPEDQE